MQTVPASGGGYGLLAGPTLTQLSATGEQRWSQPVPGSYADSSTKRVPLQKTIALAATRDGGFVVLAIDSLNRYYLTRLDSLGVSAWTKTVSRPNIDPAIPVTQDALATAADGSLLVVGSYQDVLSYLTLTKLNAEGLITGEWRIRFSGPSPLAAPRISKVVARSDQGYLLVGQAAGRTAADGQGLVLQLDAQLKVVWQKQYPDLLALTDVLATSENGYVAIGVSRNHTTQLLSLSPGTDTQPTAFPGVDSLVALAQDARGNLTLLDAARANQGDFRLIGGSLPATVRWTKSVGGSGTDRPSGLLATDDGGYLAVGTTTSTDGDIQGKSTAVTAAWVVKLGNTPQLTTLRLLAPDYDCQSGFIHFHLSGGDGSTITYTAPGITRGQLTDDFGTVESGLRNDPKVIRIQASQSGQTVSYNFDLRAQCPTSASAAASDSLQVIAPTYDCRTGAITFHSRGGDGSPIEYAAAGITDWTTNPNQVVDAELRTAYDARPLVLMARQHGQVATYLFNLKAACGRARAGVDEPATDLSIRLLGNPAREWATVEIAGAEGQSVELRLVDASGRFVEQRTLDRAQTIERQAFDIRRQATSTLLLYTTVGQQTQVLKILKQ
ncbi:hypothetical protein GCM10028773_48100 [Spirosoma koreense]